MLTACIHVHRMTTMIQIRNVPDRIHRTLKARAARAGLSLSDYLLRELSDLANRPTPEEMRARLERRARVIEGESSADAVHAERVAR